MTRAICLLALLGLSSPLAAQAIIEGVGADSRIAKPEPPKTAFEVARTRQVHALFGQCVVKRHQTAASNYVLQVDLDRKQRTKLQDKVADGECLGEAVKVGSFDLAMKLPGDTLRYTLADALIRAELPSSPIATFAGVPRLGQRKLDAADFEPKAGSRPSERTLQALKEARSIALAAIFMSAVGECVVRTDPLGSFALLGTSVGSTEESARVKALITPLSACIPADKKLSLDTSVVRGIVALNYYRLAKASRPVEAGASQ